jgi:hypothetical protein
LAAPKKAVELRRHRNTTAASPTSQTTTAQILTRPAIGWLIPASVSTVPMANSIVPVILAQFWPRWQPRAMKIHAAAPIRPTMLVAAQLDRPCSCAMVACASCRAGYSPAARRR